MSFSSAKEYKKFIHMYYKNEYNVQDSLKLNITKENECIF